MPSQTCNCGATYRFPDASVGKRAKCKKCGSVFTLQDDDGMLELADEPDPTPVQSGPIQRERIQDGNPVHTTSVVDSYSDPIVDAPTPKKSYRESVLWTLLFPSSPHNLVTFIMLWVFLAVVQFGAGNMMFFLVLGVIIQVAVAGWYAAYQFSVVANSAAGDEDIPGINISADGLWEYCTSALKWFGSWALVCAPAMIFFGIAFSSTSVQGTLMGSDTVVEDTFALVSAGPTAWITASGRDLVFLLLLGLGVTAWPMVILCVALGGFSSLTRPDLLIKTALQARTGYLLTLVMLAGAISFQTFLNDKLDGVLTSGFALFIKSFLLFGVKLYTDIVVMKFIGLYYHHFKHKFAWSWG